MATSTSDTTRPTPPGGQDGLIRAIVAAALAAPDRTVARTVVGGPLVGVLLGGPDGPRAGIASRVDETCGLERNIPHPETAHGLARWLADPPPGVPGGRSLGMAAVNALLPPPPQPLDVKGQDLILERGRGGRVVVVGHFPFVERQRGAFEALDVLEMRPRPGDLPAEQAAEVLPRADVAAITGTALLNGTLDGLLSLVRPDAFVLVLGPSTPLVPALLDMGIDALAGSLCEDHEAVLEGVRRGLAFKAVTGVRPVILGK